MTDTTTIADTTQEVTEATQQAVKQVNQITQYLQDSIPGLITFGLEVLAALVAFFIGRLMIKWIRCGFRSCVTGKSFQFCGRRADSSVKAICGRGLYY